MTKEKIGKIQLVIGIIMLILVIIGMVYSIMLNNKIKETSFNFDKAGFIQQNSQFSEGEATILYYELYSIPSMQIQYFIYTLWGILALGAFISILFITQGISKLSEE